MGYRSDVAIGFLFKDAEAVTAFMTSIKLLGDRHMDDAIKDYKVLPDHVVYALFDNVKWYDNYEDVQSHMKMLDVANKREIPNVFVRIGEDTDDVEFVLNEHYDGGDGVLGEYFNVKRTIEHPHGGEYFVKREGEANEPQ